VPAVVTEDTVWVVGEAVAPEGATTESTNTVRVAAAAAEEALEA
jgi:hypothetical protein